HARGRHAAAQEPTPFVRGDVLPRRLVRPPHLVLLLVSHGPSLQVTCHATHILPHAPVTRARRSPGATPRRRAPHRQRATSRRRRCPTVVLPRTTTTRATTPRRSRTGSIPTPRPGRCVAAPR